MRFLKSRLGQRQTVVVIFLSLLACWLLPPAFAQDQTAQPADQAPVSFDPAPPEKVATPQTPVIGGEAKPTEDKTSGKPDEAPASAIKLGPGDLVEVGVYGVPELTTKARVSNDGDLYLPLIDYVHVGDLSLEESQKRDFHRGIGALRVNDDHRSHVAQGAQATGQIVSFIADGNNHRHRQLGRRRAVALQFRTLFYFLHRPLALNILLTPALQDKQRPWARPRSLSSQEIRPHLARAFGT
jgi:hypothetical protein